MGEYGIETYGDQIADLYDLIETPSLETEPAIERLAALAGPGPILELGVGTGRLALPLAERGIEVHGIEASNAMIDKLRAKPGGDKLTIVQGDFASIKATDVYSMIFVAFDTFYALRDQEEQIRCLANVRRALTPDGVFVLEGSIPDPARLSKEQDISLRFVDSELVVLKVARYDTAKQMIVGQYILLANGVMRMCPVQVRYVWPGELNVMARMSGLSLRDRWGGWNDEPYASSSKKHISVFACAE